MRDGFGKNMKKELKKVIKALVLDIDGVLTDGTVAVYESCRKRVFLRVLDTFMQAILDYKEDQ